VPFHFADAGMVNAVTNAATDPVSGMPEFKVCAVQVTAEETEELPLGTRLGGGLVGGGARGVGRGVTSDVEVTA
jgi:hypothetical protein